MQIILATKCPVDIKYRYMTGSPTKRYKTVNSLERGLTAQSVPQPEINKSAEISIRGCSTRFTITRVTTRVIV